MTKDELMKYCDPSIEHMSHPFSHGLFTYATNGHMIIRVARMDDVPERNDAPTLDKIEKYFDLSSLRQSYDVIPDFTEPRKRTCSECGGKGKDFICPECGGTGKIEWDTDYHDYKCLCKSCLGEKIIYGACPKCHGAGHYFIPELLRIGTQYYDKRYLAMIRDLPDSTFAPGSNLREPGCFMFSEGKGLLMPCKE